MQTPVKERIEMLRDKIAEIGEANRLYLQSEKTNPEQQGIISVGFPLRIPAR
jgi:hypothetical protein